MLLSCASTVDGVQLMLRDPAASAVGGIALAVVARRARDGGAGEGLGRRQLARRGSVPQPAHTHPLRGREPQFTANEIVALARTFDLPVLYFFLPPEDDANALEMGDSPPEGWPWEYLLLLVWGHAGNFPILADRTAPWAHASPLVTIPQDDVLDGTADEILLDRVDQSRERYSPDDMLALAFHGLARRRMRGSMIPGEEVATFANNLRGLANALDAFNNYQPGTFLDADRIRDMDKAKHQRKKKE